MMTMMKALLLTQADLQSPSCRSSNEEMTDWPRVGSISSHSFADLEQIGYCINQNKVVQQTSEQPDYNSLVVSVVKHSLVNSWG